MRMTLPNSQRTVAPRGMLFSEELREISIKHDAKIVIKYNTLCITFDTIHVNSVYRNKWKYVMVGMEDGVDTWVLHTATIALKQ